MKGGFIHKFYEHNLHLAGILQGRPRIGPWAVQLDPTNACDNACIACWTHSPLFPATAQPDREARLTLDEMAVLIRDLAGIGTRMIYVSGGGEPFCHPQIWELLALIRGHGMAFSLHSNLLWGEPEALDRLLTLRPAQLTVSLWASSPASYARTNPGRTTRDFDRICAAIRHLSGARGRPRIKLHFVITRVNFRDLDGLPAFAHRLGADVLELAPVDPVPGVTDSLNLNQGDRVWLDWWLRTLRYDKPRLPIEGMESVHRLSCNPREASREEQLATLFPCLVGYFSCRVLATGAVLYCLKAHRAPIGNIRFSSFTDIWQDPAYQALRNFGMADGDDHSAFNFIGNNPQHRPGCLAGCDDLPVNRLLRARLSSLAPWKRKLLLHPWAKRFDYV